MQKKLFVLFLTFLVFGMLVNAPLVLGDDDNETIGNNSGQGSVDSGSNITAAGDDSDEDDDENETEVQINGKRIKIMNQTMTATQAREIFRARNKLRLNQSELPENCTQTGSVIRCGIEGGRAMVVMAGQSGNTIVKVNGVNMSTRTELYHHNGGVYGVLDNNETKLINFFPDQVREMIRARINATTEGNESIELDGEGFYQVEAKKRAKLFWLFSVKEKVKFKLDPETGEFLRIRGPWWGFLANDVEEE